MVAGEGDGDESCRRRRIIADVERDLAGGEGRGELDREDMSSRALNIHRRVDDDSS